ncbi:unnamed protein product [Heligmosomoides polygyrus]|uniref:Reverse transcriptase domain-containing protein n=1 Tax=Heligmosomoides polygyrus TaxID=6339 RepID=A0A183G1B1_HELPZ|nr:unnamed protein product [Heligmosomoides polygyrus]
MDMYEGSKAAIRTSHGMTRKIAITVRAHRGSALSPIILYADDMARQIEGAESQAPASNGLRLNVKKTIGGGD